MLRKHFYMDSTNDGKGGGGGGDTKVDPATARTFLADWVEDAAALKTLPDDKVLGLHAKVTTANKKAIETSLQAAEKARTEAAEKAKAERAAKVPEKYDLQLPENSLLDPTWVERIAATARERGLTNEEAQQELIKHEETFVNNRAQNVAAWNKAVETDKDLGGAHFQETKANIQRFVTRFAPTGSDLGKLLHSSGYGSHPAVVKLMNAIGKAMAEDKPLSSVEGVAGKKSPAEVLYGKS